MRESIRQFVKICAETFPIPEPIYEFGSRQVEGQEELANLRPLFPGKKYIGADMQQGTGVDIILNLHSISLPLNSVGTAIVVDTLEHVEFASKAIEEVYKVLSPNGILILSSCMNFPIHNPPDYWRFTPDAFASLLSPFTSDFVGYAGDIRFPHTIIGIGFKSVAQPKEIREEFLLKYKTWQKQFFYLHGTARERFITQFIPPIALKTYLRTKSKLFGVKTCS